MLHAFGFKKISRMHAWYFIETIATLTSWQAWSKWLLACAGLDLKTSALGHLQAAAGRSVALVGPAMILQLLCLRWQLMDISTCPNTCTLICSCFVQNSEGSIQILNLRAQLDPYAAMLHAVPTEAHLDDLVLKLMLLRCPKAIDWSKYCFFKLQQHDLELALIWVTRFQKKNIYTDRVKSIKSLQAFIFSVIMLFYVDDMPTAPQAGEVASWVIVIYPNLFFCNLANIVIL